MPKPTTYQRPVPVKRQNWGNVRYDSPFGQPTGKAPRSKPDDGRPDKPDLKLDLKLPRLPLPKT